MRARNIIASVTCNLLQYMRKYSTVNKDILSTNWMKCETVQMD
jgi:hypothetical protein